MTSRTSRNVETNRILDRFTEELGEPLPLVRARRASNRVLENLASLDAFVEPDGGMLPLPRMKSTRHWTAVASVAAALLAVAVLVGTLSLPSSAQPIAKRLTGKLGGKLISPGDSHDIGEGKLIRTEDSAGEVLALRDGSRMEMSAGVELSINRAADGIQIDLAEGNIIVTAAKQHNGHLYVKTRDCMVSVVGTVFSVKAEATGSRVAVIEGEVHVQHGDVSQTLLPGQQVATNIGWSQDPSVQVSMLQQVPAPATPTTPAPVSPPVVNPDMVGEIKLILAPVDQELEASLVLKNKTLFNSLWQGSIDNQLLRQVGLPDLVGEIRLILAPVDQENAADTIRKDRTPGLLMSSQSPVLTDSAKAGYFRYISLGAVPPNGFSVLITGVQGRTISFSNSKGETFSYGCADCSFVVSETGISKVVSTSEPGIEFRLSADGNSLTATCHGAPCTLLQQQTTSVGLGLGGRESRIGASFQGMNYSTYLATVSANNPQTFTIPVSQLVAQPGSPVFFIITKPAGQ